MKFTATLSAQSTSVRVCDIVQARGHDSWFANACATGTFGGGTVTWNISFDRGVTLIPLTQDGTATAATQTAAGALNLRSGHLGVLPTATNDADIYASVGAATNPVITVSILDNR